MKKIKIIFQLIFSLMLINSCAYGPSQEKKSPLNYLSGEHYERSADIFGVPVVERKTMDTVISGKIQMDDPFAKLPRVVELNLINDGKIIFTSHTSKSGIFQFQGVFPDGDYVLEAISPHSTGKVSIKINSYQLTDVLLVMH